MRRMIVAALAVTACLAVVPSKAAAQDVTARQEQRRAELRERLQQRRAELLQRLEQRRPLLRQRLEERRQQGRAIGPMIRRQLMERRLRSGRTATFDELDRNKDGVLSREEFQRLRRRIGRT